MQRAVEKLKRCHVHLAWPKTRWLSFAAVSQSQPCCCYARLLVNTATRDTVQATCSCRYLRNITIPAVFIKKTEGQVLKDLLKPDMEDVYVVMDWNDVLPRADKARCSALLMLCASASCATHMWSRR